MKIIICDPEYKLIEVVPCISTICDEVIVVTNSQHVATRCETLHNVDVIFGDPISPSLFRRLKPNFYSRVIAMTDSDASNMLIAQIANCNTSAGKVIAIVNNNEYCNTYLGDNFSSDVTLLSSNQALTDMIVNQFLYPSITDMADLEGFRIIEIALTDDASIIGMNCYEFAVRFKDISCIGFIGNNNIIQPISSNYLFKAGNRIIIIIDTNYDIAALYNQLNLKDSYKDIVIASQNIDIANAVGARIAYKAHNVQAICLSESKSDYCDVINGDITSPYFVSSIEHFNEQECMFYHLDDDQNKNVVGASLTSVRGYPSFAYVNHGLHRQVIKQIGASQIPLTEKMTGLIATHATLSAIKFIKPVGNGILLCCMQYHHGDIFVGENKLSSLRYYKLIACVLGVMRNNKFTYIHEGDYIVENDLIIFTIMSQNFAKFHRTLSMM